MSRSYLIGMGARIGMIITRVISKADLGAATRPISSNKDGLGEAKVPGYGIKPSEPKYFAMGAISKLYVDS